MLIVATSATLSLTLPTLPSLDQPEALRASHGFSAAANWLIPGHVLLGANPTKGRGRALDRIVSICESTTLAISSSFSSKNTNLLAAGGGSAEHGTGRKRLRRGGFGC